MADPATWLIIGTVVAASAAVAGASVSTVGAVAQHNQAKANADMQAQQHAYNKRLEEREAAVIEAETAENARRQRLQAEQLKAQQRAMLGKSGAAMTSGSPLAILGQTAVDEELQIQNTHYTGYNQAMKHREQAKMFGYQGAVARAQAPSSSSLGLNIAGQWIQTTGQLAQIGSNYITGSAQLGSAGSKK